jgi:hypothetical protein
MGQATATTRIRHYTNTRGFDGIQQGGVIRAYDQGRVFAEFIGSRPLAARDAEATYGLRRGRGRHYVETDVDAGRIKRL